MNSGTHSSQADFVEAVLSIVREDGYDVTLVETGVVVYEPRPKLT